MNFTLNEIVEATGAKVLKNDGIEQEDKFTFSTDTRTIKQGEIYLPLKGANFDGEKFVDKALEMGAIGCFCTNSSRNCPPLEGGPKSEISTLPQGVGNQAKLVLKVPDALTAYLQLARFYRRKINPKTVAITGSSGKTTTKEMAYCVACEKFKTHKSELNFNNEIGLCKTILSMPEDTQVLILEMGMRGPGEIELLSEYSEPDISIIANVGTAHIGRLGSRENIAKAKCEIVKHMKENGILIAHDDELIKNLVMNSSNALIFPVRAVPSAPSVLFSLGNVKILDRQVGYSKFEYKNHKYELNIEGDYNIQNSLAVVEMGLILGMSEQEIASGLAKYQPIEKRWEMQDVKGYKVLNDSYNANPESMTAAIQTVLGIYNPPVLFVLGDMGELGEDEVKYHQQIGEYLVKSLKTGVKVITVGTLANEITKKLNENEIPSINFENNLQTSRYILDNVEFGTTIFLKASRSMKFEEIIDNCKNN